MTGDESRRRLSQIKPGEERRLGALASEILAGARRPSMALVQAWSAGDASQKTRAQAVLSELSELSVSGWLHAAAESGLSGAATALNSAAQACLAVQRRMIEKLHAMMENKAASPRPPSADRTEEREPPSRECDEAYLLARWLMKVSDTGLERAMARKRFLSWTPARRDSEIANYRKTGQWATLAETSPVERAKP